MSDSTIQPATAPAPTEPVTPKPRGYFNQAQLEDLDIAQAILLAAQENTVALATRQITADYIAGFATTLAAARAKINETGQAKDQSGAATLNAHGAERALLVALHGIQSAAKQKHRMLAEDDDDSTNFPTDGYLIGQRLNANRAALLQNASALIAKATADNLPGYNPAELKKVSDLLTAYQSAEGEQQSAEGDRYADRIQRDALIKKINTRRLAIQHAADAIWPFINEANRPYRKAFQLPYTRTFAG
jgi:hypothetical protein